MHYFGGIFISRCRLNVYELGVSIYTNRCSALTYWQSHVVDDGKLNFLSREKCVFICTLFMGGQTKVMKVRYCVKKYR